MEIDKGIQAIGSSSCLTGPGWVQWAGSWLWPDGLGEGFEEKRTAPRGRKGKQQDGRVKWAGSGWISKQKGWALLHLGQREKCGYTSHTVVRVWE